MFRWRQQFLRDAGQRVAVYPSARGGEQGADEHLDLQPQGWLRPETADLTGTWLLRFPFGPIGVAFHAGQLRWEDDTVIQPGHVIDIDDAAQFALAFPYRRRPAPTADAARFAARFSAV